MFDVMFVTHKSKMTIPTLIVTTPPRYAAIPDVVCTKKDKVYLLCLLC